MKIKEAITALLNEHPDRAYTANELSGLLHFDKSSDFKILIKTLASMEGEHLIRFTDEGKIQIETTPEHHEAVKALISGIFHAHSAGFGFVTIDEAEPDVFIAKGKTKFAIEGDEVQIELLKNANVYKSQSAEGQVQQILHHQLHHVVGTFVAFSPDQQKETDLIGFVTSRNRKIPYRVYLSEPESPALMPEDKAVVRAEITHYPSRDFPDSMQGKILQIVGRKGEMGIDVLEVLASMDIRSIFPEKVLAQAEKIPETVTADDLIGRVDFRNEITFTIDGADAKDLDDAVHAKRLTNGNFELGVHIADVSYYVKENSPLDKEAYERGTSVYVTDRVVPMLPERLSNGICSLNPRQDRLTQSCLMEITPKGQVVNYQICQSIIKTTERMTYDAVNLMIEGNPEALAQFATIAESVKIMTELHFILEKMRVKRGALNFDTTEAKILVDEKGLPVAIQKRSRGVAERMIESFMLIANETVASDFEKRQLPFIYRIHEQPKADRLQRFLEFASTFGIQVAGTANHMTQEALQDFLKRVAGTPAEPVLSTMLLRSMQQARYSSDNLGHFGLAAETYTHFTSPIRRYPDLLVHRLIRALDHATPDVLQKWSEKLPEMAEHSSKMERRAVDAEREVEQMKKAEYMQAHIGEEFEGLVSSVTRFGMFVALENTVEGLIHITKIKGDFYSFQERMLALVGEHTGKIFRIGQPIKIKVVAADATTGDIDFEYLPSDLDVKDKAARAQAKKIKPQDFKKAKKTKSNASSNFREQSQNSKTGKIKFRDQSQKFGSSKNNKNSQKFADGRKKAHKKNHK